MRILVLIGAPGSGKGTQAKKIVNEYQYEHISTGDMFRDEISRKTPLGIQAKKNIDAGQLVSDDVVIGMMKKKLYSVVKDGCVLDGFPRTLAQSKKLSSMLEEEFGHEVNKVLYINVSLDSIVARMSGRLTCSACGASYHKVFNPPKEDGLCDVEGSKLYIREDDTEEVVRKRFDTYMLNTVPVIDYYRQKELLKEINGEQEISSIANEIFNSINN